MALIVFRTVTIDEKLLEVYCYDEGINIHISGSGSIEADLSYEDFLTLYRFVEKIRLNKE